MWEQAGLCGLREMIRVWVCGGSMWAWCGDRVSEDKARPAETGTSGQPCTPLTDQALTASSRALWRWGLSTPLYR